MEKEPNEIEISEQVRQWRERLTNPDAELIKASEEMLEAHIELIEMLEEAKRQILDKPE